MPADNKLVVEIELGDGNLFPHTGKITFADPSYNSQTGTFLIRATVDNPDGLLRANQDGSAIVRVGDVARAELGLRQYVINTRIKR